MFETSKIQEFQKFRFTTIIKSRTTKTTTKEGELWSKRSLTPNLLCSMNLPSRKQPSLLLCCLTTLHFLLLFIPSTRAGVVVEERHYPSMPAVFGATMPPDIVYNARLQTTFDNPTLCTPLEEPPSRTRRQVEKRQDAHGRQLPVTRDLADGTDTESVAVASHGSLVTNTTIVEPSDDFPIALLVQRGNCSFEEKARNAMTLSDRIEFVIVYDDALRSQLVPMSANDAEGIRVGLLFVSYLAGVEINATIANQSTNVTNAGGTIVQLDAKLPLWPVGPNYQEEQQWMLAALAGFFTFLACFGCLLLCVMAGYIPADGRLVLGGRTIVTAPRIMTRRRLLTPAQVALFPQQPFQSIGEEEEDRACAICIDEYDEGEMLRVLPCSHKFHHHCLVPWLCERHASCPLCKHDIVSPDSSERDVSGEENREGEGHESGDEEQPQDSSSDDSGGSVGHTRPPTRASPWGWWTNVHRRRPVPTVDAATQDMHVNEDVPPEPLASPVPQGRDVPVLRGESA